MIGVTVTVKLQNKLAKDSIVMSLKNVSQHLFSEDRGLLMRCFTNVSDTQVDMFHLWKDKSYQLQTRKEFVKPSIKRRAVIQKAQHVQRLRDQEDI